MFVHNCRRLRCCCNLVHRKHFISTPLTNVIEVESTEPNAFKHPKVSQFKSQFHIDKSVAKWNMKITNYMRNGQCELALGAFNSMPQRNVVSWNALISGYFSNGRVQDAHKVFDEMPERDLFSWNLMLKGYVGCKNMEVAKMLFEKMPERDVVSWNTLLSGYTRCGLVDEAKELFDRMPEKNSISWNATLALYVQNGRVNEAERLFGSRREWELVSWNCLMGGYVKQNRLIEARKLFDIMRERDEVSWNTMISGYAKLGDLSKAQTLFEKCPSRGVFTWTAMVSGYVQNGMLDEARRVFDQMPVKNAVSWNSMIVGYSQCKRMDIARELFDAMPVRDVSSWNTMITGYANSGDLEQAKILFDKMPQRDPISWSAMIAGFSQSARSDEALHLFVEMQRGGVMLNKSGISSILSTCADIGVLELGMQVHGFIFKVGYERETYVSNALLAMYCKSGSIENAKHVFEDIPEKDSVSWDTIIVGYARHGFGEQALAIFDSMSKASVKASEVTMIPVLSACSHAGLVDKAKEYFHTMYSYGVVPSSRHYTCMIDLLGRSGRLDEAQNLVKSMPFPPDATTWGALLGAARVHRNIDLAEMAAERMFELEPDNSGTYVLLSNLYAASGRWDAVRQMRLKMRDKGVKKLPGYSWLEVNNRIHIFSAGDTCHPEKVRIYTFLEELESRMKQAGYVSSVKLVLHDVDDEEKEYMLKYHSERLAVAFGILTMPVGKPIRIMKNLRTCEDCHTAIKYISELEGRVIIVRDSTRFHHFKEGSCSCGDYW